MKKELEALKQRYIAAKSENEKQVIDAEMAELMAGHEDDFAQAMLEIAKDTADMAEQVVIRERLRDILPIISVAYIAKTYFGKSKEWFYQRLNGNLVNGKPAEFAKDELTTLQAALQDIAKKIGSASVS
ncbi:MAG: DUF5053 domain-containing protein [Weeksellaceae bacterium]|nr:DUF5053 domain-containing protein [Weeksellaceae bacterium]